MASRVTFCLLFLALLSFVHGFTNLRKTKSDCELPLYVGPCDGRYHSYYFDMKARECTPFIWSGCGGNGNRFYSLDECQFACSYYMKLS